jgi:hypothetical protein
VGGQTTQTNTHTNIYSIFRDKLSLVKQACICHNSLQFTAKSPQFFLLHETIAPFYSRLNTIMDQNGGQPFHGPLSPPIKQLFWFLPETTASGSLIRVPAFECGPPQNFYIPGPSYEDLPLSTERN